MAGGFIYNEAKFAGSLFVFICLCTHHFIFVHGTGNAIQKTKEIVGMHEGAVKTIESEDEDIIDCVDINKQPAFNHPFLKDHTIQMQPNFLASNPSVETKNSMFFQSWHKNGECPEGTIPIRRTQETDYPPRSYPPIPKPNQNFIQYTRHEYAQVTLTNDVYDGAHAFLNVWKPKVYNKESTSAQIWVLAGSDLDLNAMEVGWMVKKDDNASRLFIYWTTDGYQDTGCYDLHCPGFVQVNKRIALGSALLPVSTFNGQQQEMHLVIRKDMHSGNWWLMVLNQIIGYWPGLIFTELSDAATAITWGGEVINKNVGGWHTATQMGSGHFPGEGFGKANYFRNIGYYRSNDTVIDAKDVVLYANRPECYDVHISNDTSNFGTHFFFGGPGFSKGCL